MSLTEDELALLDDNRDDWYGLWEVQWWFDAVQPDWSQAERADYLSGLVQRGLMEIFFGRIGPGSELLDIDAAKAALQVPEHWLPRTDVSQAVYHVSTSEVGLAALNAAGL